MTYHGRHRAPARPRTGARAAVIAGLALAAPLASALPASAAEPTADWGAIAMCESGGQNIHTKIVPSVNTASGLFQITNGTWKGAGGTQFAPTAMQASPSEQLVVAKRIAAARGSLADWSSSQHCWSGARKGSMSLAGTSAPKAVTSKAAKPTKATAIPGEPKAHTQRAAATVKAPTGKVATGRGLPQVPDGYVIRHGDTLGKLAAQWHVPGGYRALAAANGVDNPHMIYVGNRLS